MRLAPAVVVAAVTAVILAATLQSAPLASEVPVTCVFCGHRATADAIANLILFLPFGAALAWWAPASRKLWRLGPALSLFIELTQRFIAGRDASLGDVIMNSLGTWIGWMICRSLMRGVSRPKLEAWPSAVLAFATMIFATVWLLQPAVTSARYYGQWTPVLGGNLEWYRGRVLRAELNHAPLTAGPIGDPTEIDDFVMGGGALEVRFVAGQAIPRVGSLVSVYDSLEREIFLVGPDRNDVVFRYRRHATTWRFDEPDVRFLGAAGAWSKGDTLTLTVSRADRAVCLDAGGARACRPAVTPGRAWSLVLYPESLAPWLRHALDLLWLAGLAGLLGWWSAGWRTGVAGTAVVGAALMLIPPLLGSTAAPFWEIFAGIVGLWAGLSARYYLSERRHAAINPVV